MFYILILLVFLTNASDLTDSQQQICQSIKQLQAGTGFDKYLAKAQELKQNKLSACSCVNYLLKERERKSRALLTETLALNSTFWEDCDKQKNNLIQQDKKQKGVGYISNKNLSKLSIEKKEIEPYLNELKNFIQNNSQVPLLIKFTKKGNGATRSYNDRLQPLSPFTLAIDPSMFIYLKGSLLHELSHIKRYHSLYFQALARHIANQQIQSSSAQTVDDSVLRFQRLTEAEADRIPQACRSCDDSIEILNTSAEILDYHLFQRLSGSQSGMKFIHPAASKRFEWAVRIAKLKQSEEILH